MGGATLSLGERVGPGHQRLREGEARCWGPFWAAGEGGGNGPRAEGAEVGPRPKGRVSPFLLFFFSVF